MKDQPKDTSLPPCFIYVDRDGRMWHKNAKMRHEGINKLLMENVHLDKLGNYTIRMGDQECYVEVEDTFFVITRFETVAAEDGEETFMVRLNDGGIETLDCGSLFVSLENVLYCTVKNGRFPARFLRKSYYQLAERVEEEDGKFFLAQGGKRHPITILEES